MGFEKRKNLEKNFYLVIMHKFLSRNKIETKNQQLGHKM